MIKVKVTNITRGQIISPVVIASHTRRFEPLFELGEPATEELAMVAEDAIVDELFAALNADPDVLNVLLLTGAADVIMPGESATATVHVRGRYRHLSMVAMRVTTNDAFFALRSVRVPRAGSRTYLAPAYDAGSEANNENCDFIPGPPCGKPGVRDTEGAEGYVHIHAGIHGTADLDSTMHDWHNPVAQITVRRVSGRHYR